MDESMMAPAQEAAVGDAGFTAIDPVDEVMAITPRGWAIAAGETAVLVANRERAHHRRRERAGAPTDIDRLRPAVQKDPGHCAVACDAPDNLGVDGLRPLDRTGGSSRLLCQGFYGRGDREMGLLAAGLGERARVEALTAELDQRIRAALAAGCLVIVVERLLASVDRGAHDGAAFSVETAVDHIYAVQRLADVEIPAVVVLAVGCKGAVGILAVANGPGDVAKALWIEVVRSFEKRRLLARDRLNADFGDRVRDDSCVVESDLTRRQRLADVRE